MYPCLRPASAESATVTYAAAYAGAVLITTLVQNRALTCPDEGVRFGPYDKRVTSTPVPESTFAPAGAEVTR